MNNYVHSSDGKPKSAIFVGIFALVAGFGVFWLAGVIAEATRTDQPTADRAPLVQTVTAKAVGSDYQVVEEGFLRSIQEVRIVAEISGKVVEVNPALTIGGRFEKGDMLFRVEQTTFEANRNRAQADLRSARAAYEQAKSDYERQQRLADIGATATSRLEQARSQLRASEAQIGQAKAALETASKAFADTIVRAPFAGRVKDENVSVGQFLSPGMGVATIFDASAAEIIVSLSPRQAAGVKRAAAARNDALRVEISPTDGSALSTTLTGRVVEFSSALDPNSRTIDVLVRSGNAFSPENDGLVFAEDFVSVTLPARSDAPLYEVSQAVIRRQSFAWMVSDDNTLVAVDTTPVERRGQSMLFSSKAEIGDHPLVVTPLTEEVEGMRVRLAEDDPQSDQSKIAQSARR